MKTIEVSDDSPKLDEVLKLASEENIILKTVDGRNFVLAEVDDFEREIQLTRQNQELMRFLDDRSMETKTYSIDEVRRKLKLR
jgi:hypothetical protein